MEKDFRNLYVMSVTGPDINNGPGFRITVWVSGCKHNCLGCQNKHTHAYGQGHWLLDKYPNCNEYTYEDRILYLASDKRIDGITLSGGDPLDQGQFALEQLREFLLKFKKACPNKTIWLYTGCVYENLDYFQMQVAKLCDVIVDGPYIQEYHDITIPFRGSTNQRIIDVKKSIDQMKTITIDDNEFKV